MRLNGHSIEHPDENDEMLEAESRGVAGRVGDLERRVLEQGDELVCLKATLAEALRRITMLEGIRLAQHQQMIPTSGGGGLRNGAHNKDSSSRFRQNNSYTATVNRMNNSSSTSESQQQQLQHRRSYYGNSGNISGNSGGSVTLPQTRRAVHYQSTGSLHSDSHSSSSVSPVPSPSPRVTPVPVTTSSTPPPSGGGGSGRRIAPPSTPPPTSSHHYNTALAAAAGTSSLHKRWSSTGDFNHHQGGGGGGGRGDAVTSQVATPYSKYSTKSFLNLYKPSSPSHSSTFRHGSGKEVSYNPTDNTVKLHLRGRPVVLSAPTVYSPTGETPYDPTTVTAAPSPRRLQLDWAFGYRGKDCRANLHPLPTGEMVYFVAAVVVLYNVEEQHQRHYLGHTDDVKSIAVHPSRLLVATGQCAGHDRDSRAHVRVWDTVNLSTVAVLGGAGGDFTASVCCLSFSKNDGGALLLAVDESPDHVLSVWDWQKGDTGHKITETKCSVDTIVAADFHPLDHSLITCGKSHLAFWSLDSTAALLYKRMAVFGGRDKPRYVLCVAFLQTGDVITGDSSGNLAVWGRGTNTVTRHIKGVHEGGVFAVCVLREGGVVTGGGRDGRLVFFDAALARISEDSAQIEGHFGGIRVISEGRGGQLLVGTTRNCILTGNSTLGYQPIVLGHTDELWALAAHPSVQQFATAGQDQLLQMWDALSHTILWSKDIGEQAQSIAFSTDGAVVVVGCNNAGGWLIFDTQTRELVGRHSDGAEAIQTVQYSPDGRLLALGSRDNNIYVYQVGARYSRIGKCMGHSSFVTHLDWSADSTTLRSNSGDYELLFWNATTCRQIPQSSSLRDVEWATNRCILTFNTIGIWPENADGTDINTCNRSHDATLMATGDDFGKVKLYSYPVTQPKSLNYAYGGHSSHVTNVTFLHDDTRLVSIGGKDMSVLQWTVL